jgi:hypothetical protein
MHWKSKYDRKKKFPTLSLSSVWALGKYCIVKMLSSAFSRMVILCKMSLVLGGVSVHGIPRAWSLYPHPPPPPVQLYQIVDAPGIGRGMSRAPWFFLAVRMEPPSG